MSYQRKIQANAVGQEPPEPTVYVNGMQKNRERRDIPQLLMISFVSLFPCLNVNL